MQKRRVLIFFSDTGGGHRAAANALRDAFHAVFPDRYEITPIDGFKECAPFPFDHIPATYYPLTTYIPWLWGALFHWSNNRVVLPPVAALDALLLRPGCARVIRQHDPDLVISDHPLINRAPCEALKSIKPNTPFVTVVTDLLDAHGLWFSANSDLLIVPTQGAFERGLHWKFPREKMLVVGQPISLAFTLPPLHKSVHELRAQLGIQPDVFTLLLVGGGEGMGPLREIAGALDRAALPIQLVVIAGRNKALQQQLQQDEWHVPVSIQGFVKNMPDWLRASDLVITKAGPGTIMETLAAGKPMILYGYLQGQEEGNVTFVEQNEVGVLRTTPEEIVEQVRVWLADGQTALKQLEQNAELAARPRAAIEIVKMLDGLL